jgi:V/A-type H+-transporting ATPase subunit D
MKADIAATKTNLLKVRKSLSLTEEGYELLDEKRKILLSELTAVVDSVDQHQKEVDNAFKEAYETMDKAVVGIGRKRIEELSFSIDIKSELSITGKRVMGVGVPIVNVEIRENPPYYSPYEVNLYVDEAITRFKEILKLLAVLAEKKITLLRLAREAQKTIRKVNALEKVYLPYYRDTLKYIGDRLDEESRDAFAMLKLIKKEKLKQQIVT